MANDLDDECSRLQRATVMVLRQRYAAVYGESPPRTGNKTWLRRRILWRLQALAQGDLTERAKRQAALLANDADLRLIPPPEPRTTLVINQEPRDPRLPKPGTVLHRRYQGTIHSVQVMADGFIYQNTTYRSLSAVAQAITGTHGNGFLFFRLTAKEKHRAQNR
jgi:hypothetical protein